MKNVVIFALLLILATSGCVNLFGSKAMFGILEIADNPDMYLKVETSTDEVKAGRMVQLRFTIEDKSVSSLKNVETYAYDQCLFTGDNKRNMDEIRANHSDVWIWLWNATDTSFERDCTVRFKTVYDATSFISETVNVLKRSEYYTREADETLGDISDATVSYPGSLLIGIAFSEEQPFIEDESGYAYISYNDIGTGMIKQLEPTNVTLYLPVGFTDVECDGYIYNTDSKNYTLATTLKFVDKKAPQTTCRYKTTATQPIESGDFRVVANYKYQFDDSLLLKVRP